MKKIINALLRLYALPALVFSTTMTICLPSYVNADWQQSKQSNAYVQRYQLRMSLYVPRVYANSNSLGYRKYQLQHIRGTLSLEYNDDGRLAHLSFQDFANYTHKLSNGKNVTYDVFLDDEKLAQFAAIGNNKTLKFNTASICFSIEAEPSYSISDINEDNSLYVTLAGKGIIRNGKIHSASGNASGTLGCGCYDYGHTSPTRLIWWWGISPYVTDVAAVYGRWSIKLIR